MSALACNCSKTVVRQYIRHLDIVLSVTVVAVVTVDRKKTSAIH